MAAGDDSGTQGPESANWREDAMPAPPAAHHDRMAQDERIFIEGRQLRHTSQDARGDHECVATPPMLACPCGAFTHLEWAWAHL